MPQNTPLLRREHHQVPSKSRGERPLQCAGGGPPEVLAQREMDGLEGHGRETAQHGSQLGPREDVGERTPRTIGPVVHEMIRIEVGPALLEKVAVMHLPESGVRIATESASVTVREASAIDRPAPHSRRAGEQHSSAHPEKDANMI